MIPLDNRVIAIPVKEDNRTKSGLILVSNVNTYKTSKVIAIGPGAVGPAGKRIPLQVVVGHIIYHPTGAGFDVEVDGQKAVCLLEHEIFAIKKD